MKFADLPTGTIVLYTYHYTSGGVLPEVAQVTSSSKVDYSCIQTIYSTFSHTTKVHTMDSDNRATLISIVSSVDDAMQRFPELFI